MSLRWVITGGGTGGHVTPALALGETLRDAGDPVLFIGTNRGIERRLVPDAGFELATLDSRPLIGRSPIERLRGVIALLKTTWHARRLLRDFRAERVISVGGYASAPAALAAVWCRIPMVLVNTDVMPGAANRLLARFAKKIFVGFPQAAERFGAAKDRVVAAGVPLRQALHAAFEKAPEVPAETEARRLFIFGGSQGARQINDGMLAAIPALLQLDPPVQIVHQTGESDVDRVEEAYRAAKLPAHVTAFETNMPSRYKEADLIVCRAGAISIAELTLAARPSLLVPLAHVGGGEQFDNARVLVEAGAAQMIDSREFENEAFAERLVAMLESGPALKEMGRAAGELARPHAAAAIIEACRGLVTVPS